MKLFNILLHWMISFLIVCNSLDVGKDELEVSNFIEKVNKRLKFLYTREVITKAFTEIKGPNDTTATDIYHQASNDILYYFLEIAPELARYKKVPIENSELRKQLTLVPETSYEVLPNDDLRLMDSILRDMGNTYKNVKLCSYKNENDCNLSWMPDIQNIVQKSEDAKETEHYWLELRRKTGANVRDYFETFAALHRKAAEMKEFSKPSDFWHRDIRESSSTVSNNLKKFMWQLKPLFNQLHAYIRGRLRLVYGPEVIEYKKPIPQHLAEQFLNNVFKLGETIELPFNAKKMSNITENLLKRGITDAKRSFLVAREFFRSVGMPHLEESFFQENCKQKSYMNDVNCRHKAWPQYSVFITNCTYCSQLSEYTFFNMFEVISDVYRYRSYDNLITLYQIDPIPNFSDAINKFFSLAASSPKYLERLKIFTCADTTKQARINRLYVQGLRTIFSMPLLYIQERYCLDVFDNITDIRDNCAYWRLAEEFTGAAPPVTRSNADYDVPAKLFMELDEQYATHIYGIVLQYQILEHFCSLTGEYVKGNARKSLDMCNLKDHHIVGEKIYKVMSLGASVDFKEALQLLVDSTELDMSGLLEYYRPLYEWLKKENDLQNYEVGWEPSHNLYGKYVVASHWLRNNTI